MNESRVNAVKILNWDKKKRYDTAMFFVATNRTCLLPPFQSIRLIFF
jgi:hypothetical protein